MMGLRLVPAIALVGVLAAWPSPASGPATRKAATTNVQMIGDAKGMRFEAAKITIHVGDVVTWTDAGAVPHNVAFWADSIPAKAKDKLQASMPKTMQPLTGPMIVAANEKYSISFAGAVPGVYKYYCLPHLALGMVGQITVQP